METALTETMPRRIACEGAFNIRDLGGYDTADGGRTRWRRIFRADGLHRIPQTAQTKVLELGWRTVLDLRTPGEVEAGQYARDGVDVVHLPVLQETWSRAAFDASADAVTLLADRYMEMLEVGAGAIAAAVGILASDHRIPAVFHCSAGKDRTGVLAALILSTVGVADDTIAADYHLSADAMADLVEWIVASRPEVAETMARQPSHILKCPPEAMTAFLASVGARYGCAAQYLAWAGVEASTLRDLRGVLVEYESR